MLKNIAFIIFIFNALLSIKLYANETQKIVFHFKISDNIDPRTNRLSELALNKAEELHADLIILEIDTYGGALNDADEIRTRILNCKIPIFAYINKDAASAGALISIACDSIYMSLGSSIGAATVVVADGTAAPDKYQSYMRSIMRSTAEANGRNPRIAEAMVDQDIKIDSISQENKVLTFSVSEAIKYGYCEGQVSSIEDILAKTGYSDYKIETYELSTVDTIISFFINPIISGILILIIIGGIYYELQTPGVGFPILASIIASVLYFAPYYLNGMVENWEIILFFIGIILLFVEVFIIPGFGVFGILGITFTFSALILGMLNNDGFNFDFVPNANIINGIITVFIATILSIILLIIAGIRLTSTSFFKNVALNTAQNNAEGYHSTTFDHSLINKEGITSTVLRPSGKIVIDDNIYEAMSISGDYINPNTKVKVVSIEGATLKVKIL